MINSVFAVPMDQLQRLTIDARPAKEIFEEPPKVVLPTRNHLARFMIMGDAELLVGKSDMDLLPPSPNAGYDSFFWITLV